MGADACPVPEGEGSWLFYLKKLTTEAPVNGGRNYDGPKVKNAQLFLQIYASLSKTKLYAGNSSKTYQYSFKILFFVFCSCENLKDTGTISREDLMKHYRIKNPQRLYV